MGSGAVTGEESIRYRLGHMQSRSSLLDAATADAVYYRLGVTREGFVEAREYLREELRAFDRSGAAVLDPQVLPDGATTADRGIVLYGAVRNPPRQLHASYWAALLRYDPSPSPTLTTYTAYDPAPDWALYADEAGNVPPGDTWGTEVGAMTSEPRVTGRRTLASVVDEGYRRIPAILERLCPAATCPIEPIENARDVFVRLLADASPDPELGAVTAPDARWGNASIVGRARACVFVEDTDPTDFDVRLEVTGVTGVSASDLLVVRGRDGLSCAVDGHLEDVPCTAAQLGALVTGAAWSQSAGIWRTFAFGEPLASRPTPGTISLFVVRSRPGVTVVPGAPQPGQWEELTGFVLPAPTSPTTLGYRYCQGAVIAPALDREAAALIEPSSSPPHRPAESCAGLPSDLRIPLENEITSDSGGAIGAGAENSWAHYLALARTAATEADTLGEDLIRTGLEMDLRSEGAADELSRLCGVAVNVTTIAGAVEEGPPPEIDGTMGCSPPYVRQGTRCVLDPVLYAAQRAGLDDELGRLAGCLGVDRVPWASLGDTVLCIWDANGAAAGGICEGSDPEDMPCPYVAPSDAEVDADCAGPMPPGASPILVSERVGIFQRPAEIPAPPLDPNDLPCAALARVRAGGSVGSWEEAERLIGMLTYEGFGPHARNLTWEAAVGDHSTVRYAGSLVFRTGSVSTGTPLWPMGAPPPGACPAGAAPSTNPATHEGPLFCLGDLSTIVDDDGRRLARARVNDLLARAVLAARISTGSGLDGIVFPYYSSTRALTYKETAESFDWQLFPTSSPFAYRASTGELTIDNRGGDSHGEYPVQAADLGSSFAFVEGSGGAAGTGCSAIPVTAEWSACPYRGAVGDCVIFDDGPDCDDAARDDRDVPLILRTADRGLANNNAGTVAPGLWNARGLAGIPFLALRHAELHGPLFGRMVEQDVQGLTHYFDTWAQAGVSACDLANYEQCVADRPHMRLLDRGNLAFVGPNTGLTVNDFLNGLELTCWAARSNVPVEDTSCEAPAAIETLSDAYRMRGYLECRANEISAFGSAALVQDLPRRVVDAMRRDGTGTYGSGAGEFDAQVSELRAAFLELGNHRLDMAADMRAFSARILSLDSAVSRSERAREIERLSLMGRALDRMTQCITAAAEVATVDAAAAGGKAASAAVTCANSVGQVILDRAISRLRDQDVDDAIIDEFARFTVEATEFGRRMSQRSNAIRAALERIDAALARLRVTQTGARRALARALMLEDDGTGRHFDVNTAYRARYSTLLARYRRAHLRAVRAAFIARIALEQRLGMPLSDIEDDVFSDESPREWVDTICTLPSIDYDRIRSSAPGPSGAREDDGDALPVPADYSGAYVGDYVRRLEQVFESYSFVHPFREGADTAVISLRDDVRRTRAPCPVESPNLLYNGGRLDVFAGSSRPGWSVEGCDVAAGSGTERHCLSVVRQDGGATENPLGVEAARFGRPVPYLIELGSPPIVGDSTRLEQVVRLPPGRYRLSAWLGGADYLGMTPWTVQTWDDDVLLSTQYFSETAPNGWVRRWTFFDVASERDVRVVLPRTDSTVPATIDAFNVAGVMLEDVTRSVVGDVTRLVDVEEGDGTVSMGVVYGQRAAPGPYYESGDDGLPEVRACIDHTGQYFRREAWERGCVRVCSDGYDGDCPAEWAETRCYWQTSLPISSDTLSNLLVAGDAGFAAGNYNYRIESVGVNLVGTGLRDCAERGSSGCYGAGNASYSMLHLGPYLVRNARGALYEAPLFPGRLESARALAAERYLTNPLSGADRTLLDPYTRYELQGRPLGGALVLRLWDDPTFRFDRLEDVQLVLTYRYWQHQR